MAEFFKNKQSIIVCKILFAIFLFCAAVFISPRKIIACSHIDFEYSGGDCGLIMTDHDLCCYSKPGGEQNCIDKYIPAQCKPWQINNPNDENSSNGDDEDGTCNCAAQCLDAPANPKYYDDPVNHTLQKDTTRINLPVVLAWDNIRGWLNLGYNNIFRGTISSFCSAYKPNPGNQGPQSYRVEIKYDEPAKGKGDPNLNIDKTINPDNNIETLKSGQKIFFKVITESGLEGFNSRDDGGGCFFQTNTSYQWRVRPCCAADGNPATCKPMADDENWWTFTASPAPEPLGIFDGKTYNDEKNPKQDPDWNGGKHLENVNFCSAKLLWCKAKLVTDGSNNRFSSTFNGYGGKIAYAINYQMRVKFSENWSLGFFKNITGGSATLWDTSMANAMINTVNYAQGLASYLTNELKNALNIPQTDYENGESCHYLEKQNTETTKCKPENNGCCKPEFLPFSSYLNDIMANPNFRPSFSAAENKNQDRNLFSGDLNGDLTYSWQTKVCFTEASNRKDAAGKDDAAFPTCAGYNNEDYGQKWKFSGEAFTPANLLPPTLQSPPDNKTKNSDAPANLVGLGNIIQWSAPCGANSFLYDITDNKTGKSIFNFDTTYGADQGRRINISQVLLTLTDKYPAQDNDPKQVNLKINTLYRWQVKSCWPSMPVQEKKISEICSDKWSPLNYFYTTGRKPSYATTTIDAPNATLSWEDVPGRGSYRLKITGDGAPAEQVVATNQFTFTYPEVKYYHWEVRTCADAAGKICGDPKTASFNSKIFDTPTNLNPGNDATTLPLTMTWSGKANYFKINLTYAPLAGVSAHCTASEINIVDAPASTNSYPQKTSYLTCPGNYTFEVQPCFKPDCSETAKSPAAKTSFSIADKDQKETGFMVCGQTVDNPATKEYDESDHCEIRHLFLTLKIIIDFIILKLAFILLPVLVLITGGLFYLAEDKSKLVPTLKDSWKKIGYGYLFLIFAWLIVSILMMFAGYQNDWWKII